MDDDVRERASFYPSLAQVLQAAGFKEGGAAHSNAGSAEWAGAFISARVQSVLLNARTLGPCRAIPLGPPSVRQGRAALSIGITTQIIRRVHSPRFAFISERLLLRKST
jgi:hypothetical protein